MDISYLCCMKGCILFLYLFLFSLITKSQLNINYDYAVFNSSGVSYIEFYYSYPDNSYTLKYDTLSEVYFGHLTFELSIDSGINEKWEAKFQHKRDTANAYVPQDFYGVQRIVIPTGTYNATISVVDMYSENRKFEKQFELNIPATSNKIWLSSLQIANTIMPKQADTNHIQPEAFYKNQYYVYPNPVREISSDIPTLHLYSEIYQAHSISPTGVNIVYTIRNAKNEVEFEYSKHKSAPADAIVEVISIPIDAMPSGVYTVEMAVTTSDKQYVAKQSNKFYLINNNIETAGQTFYTEDEAFAMSEFATYGEERLNLEYEQFKVLVNRDEANVWEKLTTTKAKQRFLYRFWWQRNTDQNNPYNPVLAEYRDRLKYAITYYSYAGENNGWKSDRGKVYIKYGAADHKEQSPGTPQQRAYEIWSYNAVEGGIVFCFVDIFGMENYKLVHSTAFGQIRNDNWKSILNSTVNTNEY